MSGRNLGGRAQPLEPRGESRSEKRILGTHRREEKRFVTAELESSPSLPWGGWVLLCRGRIKRELHFPFFHVDAIPKTGS